MSQGAGKEAEDPSMEDILASIRRILNDDEPAAEAAHGGDAGATPVQQSPPVQDDVFLLDESMLVEEPPFAPPPVAPLLALQAASAPPLQTSPAPEQPHQQAIPAAMTPAPAPSSLVPAEPAEALISPTTAAAASASMGALVRVMGQQQTAVYRGGPTLEDMVRDEIRPMVKSWLDEHLPPMVERMVRAEIARVTEGK